MVRQRELLLFLVWRDIKVRYKQAVLGIAWVVLQPIINVIIWTLIFGSGLNLASQLGAARARLPRLRLRRPAAVACSCRGR